MDLLGFIILFIISVALTSMGIILAFTTMGTQYNYLPISTRGNVIVGTMCIGFLSSGMLLGILTALYYPL